MITILNRIKAALNSRHFFWAVMVLFLVESAWIALSAVYPQAFDENFHFGLIQIYSHYWLPFLATQPANANAYGAMVRDPSYLYHYTMSFPYRLLALFVHGQGAQIIILRFINIALAGLGLILFQKVLLKARVSRALTNVSLLLFVLIPIVPQLAGQVNYDNLLFPLVAWSILLAMRAIDEISNQQPSVKTLLSLFVVCTLSSLVKFEFLPIFAGIVLFLAYKIFRNFKGKWRLLGMRLLKSWRHVSRFAKFGLAAAVIITLGLFAQRDGINIIEYHTVAPDCSQVLSVQSCNEYSVWNASYYRHQAVIAKQNTIHFDNPIQYTGLWFYWMWYRLFFAVNGPASNFTNYPPLPLPALAAVLIGIASIGVLAFWARRVFKSNPYITLFAVIVVTYLLALWVEGFTQYRYTNTLVLMNGRYLLPILLPVAAVIGVALAKAFRHMPTTRTALASLTILLFIQGGGVLTFIIRSDANWDWHNTAVVKVNNAARDALHPLVVEGSKSYDTRVWVFN